MRSGYRQLWLVPAFFIFYVLLFPSFGWTTTKVIFNLDHKPFPRIPFPNNILTTEDPETPSGRKVQFPYRGIFTLEQQLSAGLNHLDGFGTFSPITVSFTAPLDLDTVTAENILLINITPQSQEFGDRTPLDFDSGVYPYALKSPTSYFHEDPMGLAPDFLFRLGNRKNFYEDETNTLILRPLQPLREKTTYAVILLKGLKGTDGESISGSPMSALTAPVLRQIDVDPRDIAYSWKFTTQNILHNLQKIRQGLYGEDAISYLRTEFPPVLKEITYLGHLPFDADGNPFTFDTHILKRVLGVLYRIGDIVNAFTPFPLRDFLSVDGVQYFVFGKYQSPQFNKTGILRIHHGDPQPEDATFLLSIPEETPLHHQPFPVAIFAHGNKRARVDVFFLAHALAQQGIACLCIDADDHGPDHFLASLPVILKKIFLSSLNIQTQEKIKPHIQELADVVGLTYKKSDLQTEFIGQWIDRLFNIGILRALTREGRASDIDGDKIADSGEQFFSGNVFMTRDIIRQTVVDHFQLIRVLRNLGTDWNENGQLDREEGDFNGDGILDIGGPSSPISFIGMSMGGMMGSSLMALEPELKTAVLNVPGGGLTDILIRSKSKFNVGRIFYQLLGPAFVGKVKDARTFVVINNDDIRQALAKITSLRGGMAHVTNKTKGIVKKYPINSQGGFFAPMGGDWGDLLELTITDSTGRQLKQLTWKVDHRYGMALSRNTPLFREFIGISQWGIEEGDPINYARHWFLEPLENHPLKNILIQLDPGDFTVPISTGMNLARTGGLISPQRNMNLLEWGLYRGFKVPVDTLENPPESQTGSAIRFHMSGKHEYLLAPNLDSYKESRVTPQAQHQATTYLFSEGAVILP